MSFSAQFDKLPITALADRSRRTSRDQAAAVLARGEFTFEDFPILVSPAAGEFLEQLSRRSQLLTQQRFGRVIRMFAPLYLSNECINNCKYCGFSRDNPILRVTLSIEQVKAEAKALASQGFRNILLVAGEHPKFISESYLRDCIAAIRPEFPVGSSRVDLQACKLEYSIVSPK